MTNLISRTISEITSLLKGIQVKRFLAVVLVGFLVLTTNAGYSQTSPDVSNSRVDQALRQNDTQRPQTTGEWNKEARETEGSPVEKIKRIGQQSAEAVKEFGSVYPDTAQRSTDNLEDNANLGQDYSSRARR